MRLLKGALALGVAVFAAGAYGANCKTTVIADKAGSMNYDKKVIEIPESCATFSITLKNMSKLPKAAMGHNLVVSTAATMNTVAAEGMAAGLPKQHVNTASKGLVKIEKNGKVEKVFATKVLGPNEEDTISWDVKDLKARGPLKFFCSFPGHFALMQGDIKFVSGKKS